MQIIHFKKFSVPVSIGASKVDKFLKMPPDSISGSVIFQNFLGGMPPDPPIAGMLCMPVRFAHYECKYLTNPTSTMMTARSGCAPPFQKSRFAPASYIACWLAST